MRLLWSQISLVIPIMIKLLVVVILAGLLLKKSEILFVNPKIEAPKDLQIFMKDWCRIRQARTNIQSILGPCPDQLKWTYNQYGIETNASMSFVSSWDLKPAGQFSRFFIQTVSSEGALKTIGGDWWRIRIHNPVASLPSTIFDHRNGTYEVVFLVVEPGVYHLDIILDYTLCNGFKDPPQNWFILGNAQGKMQPNGILRGRAKQDYLLQPLQDGRELMINIGLPTGRGLFVFNSLPRDILFQLGKKFDLSCGINCQLIWDGYGRWANERWKPYLKGRERKDENKSDVTDDAGKTRSPLYNTLWIYGDSQAKRMYEEVQNTSLCKTIFRVCKLSSNWVYKYEGEFPSQDDLDFDFKRITDDIKRVLDLEEMSENSVMVLNLGLHYIQATNFSNYIKLLRGVVDVFESRNRRERKKSVRLIWKTTTETSKHKDTKELLYCDFKRFFTNARVAMYNAYATSFMCRKGFEILEVHPLTASYPSGTGGPKIEFYKEHDIVHYKRHVTKPFEDILEKYLQGNIPHKLNFENYQFS